MKDTVKRTELVRKSAGKFGVTMRDIFWTQGQYDICARLEAQDETAMSAFGLWLRQRATCDFRRHVH